MTQAQLLQEFRQLPLAQQIQRLQAAFEIVSAQVSLDTKESLESKNKLSLAEATELLRMDYENDEELTSLTALDGEPFQKSQQ